MRIVNPDIEPGDDHPLVAAMDSISNGPRAVPPTPEFAQFLSDSVNDPSPLDVTPEERAMITKVRAVLAQQFNDRGARRLSATFAQFIDGS